MNPKKEISKDIISVKALSKIFKLKHKKPGRFSSFTSLFSPVFKEVKAVDNISFDIPDGQLMALIGPNGAGKSTTIKMLTGILYPSNGEISVCGFSPSKDRKKLSYNLGTVFGQKPQLWYHLPPIDTYELLSRIFEMDRLEYKKRLKFLVDSFEIGDLLHTTVRKLSLGQRMRCEIVASLIHKPQVLFLDEPTIGLDIIAKQNIREVIKFLNEKEGVSVILTSHDAGDIESLAKRTIIINHGKIIFDDKTESLRKNYLKTKIIEIIVADPLEKFSFKGGKVIERDTYNIKIELDTSKNSIDALISYAINNYNLKDINIFDPSMEEIISDIYSSKKYADK